MQRTETGYSNSEILTVFTYGLIGPVLGAFLTVLALHIPLPSMELVREKLTAFISARGYGWFFFLAFLFGHIPALIAGIFQVIVDRILDRAWARLAVIGSLGGLSALSGRYEGRHTTFEEEVLRLIAGSSASIMIAAVYEIRRASRKKS